MAADEDARIEAVEVVAETYKEALEKTRQGIVGKTNTAMTRLTLFQQMEQGSQKFESWAREIYKQAQRCDWTGYDTDASA